MNTPAPSPEEIARVLALKRHEQPPRPFFKNLSTAVIDRIQHPEPPPPPTLLQRLGLDFDTKPVLICLSAAGVCALLVFGWIQSRNVKPPPASSTAAESTLPALMENPSSGIGTPVPVTGSAPNSTAPVMANTDGDRMNVKSAPTTVRTPAKP